MTVRSWQQLAAVWNDSWFFRLNLIVALVGVAYLLISFSTSSVNPPPTTTTP